jgi:hypothetical protein
LNKFRPLFFTLLGVILIGGMLLAQAPTGRIIGTVLDDEGNPLPGVAVEATSPKLIGISSVMTDETGVYRIFALPPGIYEIKYTLQAFNTVIRKGIIVKLEQTITVDITMTPGVVEEQITVLGRSPLIDVKSTYKGMILSKEMFQMLPKGRNFDTLVTAVPGVSNEPWLGGISVDGASGAENMYYIDGTDITRMVVGTRGQSAAFEFVEEIQIKASGYQAEYGGALGGVVSVITRSGGNTYHGEIIGYYSGPSLTGTERNTLRLKPEDVSQAEYVNYEHLMGKERSQRYEVGFSLGGYILKDRLWFFGSFLPVFNNITRPVVFPGETDSEEFTRKWKYYNFQAKITAQPIGGLRLSASIVNNFSKYKGDLAPRTGGNPDTDYASFGFSYPNWSAAVSTDVTLGTNFLVSLRGGYFHRNQNKQLVTAPTPWWRFQSETGGYPLTSNQQFNEDADPLNDIPDEYIRDAGWQPFSRNSTYEYKKQIRAKGYINADFNYFINLGGEHSWKAGVQWVRQEEDVDRTNSQPIVYLSWDMDFVLGGEIQPPGRGTYGYYSVRGNDATGPFGDFYNPVSTRWALYIQDSWTPDFANGRLTLNAGVRTEYEYVPSYSDEPGFKDAKPIEFKFQDKLAPRIGFIYDVFGDATTKVFGSYGLYYDVFKLYMASNAYGGFLWSSAYYTLDSYEWDQIGVNNNFPGTPMGVVNWRPPSFESTDPDLKPMSQQEISFGVERQLVENLSASVRIVNKHLRYAIEDVGVYVPGVGEEYFTCNPGYGYSLHEGTGTGKFDPSFPVTPKAKREYWAVNFDLDKRFSNNWLGGFSYTWSSLRGNYSGLASSDEYGRVGPNLERYFDLWHLAYTKDLEKQDGPMPTDRTHIFKFYGAYSLPFGLTLGGVVNAMSGTPITEEWTVEANGYYPFNRGNMGRTPFLWFVNAYAEYNLNLGGRYRLQFNLNIDNLFNVDIARRTWSRLTRGRVTVTNDDLISKTWDLPVDFLRDPRFEQPLEFYPPISARIGVKLVF